MQIKRLISFTLLALLAVSAHAQFQTGNIYGKVQAKDASPLPGVTVVLTGIAAPQTTYTDAQGNFRFLNLSPGTYSLKAELAGYGTAARTGIGVRLGANSDVTLTLNPSVSESITVTAEAPLLDTRKAGTSVNVTKVELEKIPTSRDPWTILQSAPAVQVDRINVGGSQSGQQSNYYAKNALVADNTWNVDGVNITDMGATGSSPTYYDFDAFEEMQVTTGGSDPRIMTPGVQLNMVTKRGTNDLKGSGRYFYTPGSYQADAKVPTEAESYLAKTNRINFVRDYGAEFGGPIWKDHLWGWIARGDQKISNQASEAPGTIGAFDNIVLRNTSAKLNAQLLSSNSGVLFYDLGDKVRNARNLSAFRPFETAYRQTGPTKVYKLEDTQIFGSSLYLTAMASRIKPGGFSLSPNGGFDVNAYKDADTVWHNSFNFYTTNRPQKQYRLDGSKFLDIGSMNHELKFGFGYRSTPVTSQSGWPGSTKGYWDASAFAAADCAKEGLPANCMLAFLYRDSFKGNQQKYNDAYIGDTILMGNLTIQAGLRYDTQKSHNLETTAEPNPILNTALTLPCAASGFLCKSGTFTGSLQSLTFGGENRDLKWSSLSPRIGLTYALGTAKKSLVRAAYNRYVSQMGNTIAAANPIGYYQYFEFMGVDTNGDKIIQRNELLKAYGYGYLDPASPNSVTPTTRINYSMKVPKTDEFILGFEHELLTDFSIGVNYSYRQSTDTIGVRQEKHRGQGDFYTSADFVPLLDANGKQVMAGGTFQAYGNTITTPLVPVYTISPAVPAPTFAVLTNIPDFKNKYNGLELTATKRLSHSWMMRGNVTYNNQKSDCTSNSFPNPTPGLFSPFINSLPAGMLGCVGGESFQRSAGSGSFQNVFISSKWSGNLTGLIELPLDFSVGASLTGRQGYPMVLRDRVTSTSAGVTDVILSPVGDVRFPNVYELDLRAAKDFRFFNRVGLTLSADLFNAPNQRSVLQRDTRLAANEARRSTGYRITEMQSPRAWRFGARFTF
jgi:hypothetical protein